MALRRMSVAAAAAAAASNSSRRAGQVAAASAVLRLAAIPSSSSSSSSSVVSRGASREYSTDMFCYQCEQTKNGTGCTTVGVCGKTPEVAVMQDLLLEGLKAIAQYAHRAAQLGASNAEVDAFTKAAMFSTLTNVNFDEQRFREYLIQATQMRNVAKTLYLDACKAAGKTPESLPAADAFECTEKDSVADLVKRGEQFSVAGRRAKYGDTVAGLVELVTYGLKGMAAYADHARVYGRVDKAVDAFTNDVLNEIASDKPDVGRLLEYAMAVGSNNIRVMEMLDEAHTTTFGHPVPTKVQTSAVKGKCVLVSGHDIRDLEEVLKQTEGKGIHVYTHGELLPAHGYPKLKERFPHLVANYGGAWQQQQLEFSIFPGPILMTTNCIVEPRKAYRDRIYTRSVVGYPGVKHLPTYDFKPLVDQALSMEGFIKDEPYSYTMTGFGHNAVLQNAPAIVDAVKSGAIKHFFLIGGCDGAETERTYFRDLALAVPKDAMILTLACGKYRFNKMFEKFSSINGIPRMLDMGQCNDAISAIRVAGALAKAFNTDVNGLPLSFAISWFEQKAVAVLLSLLSLNIKNIHLGPRLPAFITPDALNVLVEKFEIKPTTSVPNDMPHYMPPN